MIKYEVNEEEFDTKEEAQKFVEQKATMLSSLFATKGLKIISPMIREVEYIYVKKEDYNKLINSNFELQKFKRFCEGVSRELDELECYIE